MAQTGDRFQMSDGSLYVVRRAAAETGGEEVEMEFILPPDCVPPPPHVHPQQVEAYEVLEGRFDVLVEGEWRTLAAGESASVPRGSLHTFRNGSGAVVRVRNWHRPALRFEQFIESVSASLQAAGIRRRRDPRTFLVLAVVLVEYEDTLVAGPRQRPGIRAMARVGRWLGLRAVVR